MPKPDPATVKRLVDEVTSKLADDGMLIAAGFAALRLLAIPQDASELQVREMRRAYFAGAQYVWAAVFGIMDAGIEPTERDLRRIALIDAELERFLEELRAETEGKKH